MSYPPNYNRWPPENGGNDEFTHQPTYAPPPKKSNKGTIIAIVLAVLLIGAIVVVCAAMFGGPDNGKPVDTKVTRTTTAPAQAQKAVPKSAAPKSTAPKRVVILGNGTYRVGIDVRPGEYRSPGAEEGILQLCTWTTAKTSGFDNVIDFGTANEVNQPGLVTLKKGQYFKTTGCQPWVRQ